MEDFMRSGFSWKYFRGKWSKLSIKNALFKQSVNKQWKVQESAMLLEGIKVYFF